jgi:phage repressor protein C with HTH and peptisase S24 domain
MDTEKLADTRRRNLRSWMIEKGLNQTELAKKLEVGRAYVSLLHKRHFGEKAARAIEKKLGLPPDFLDLSSDEPKVVEVWDKPSDLPPDVYALVPRLAVKLAAGNGFVPDNEPDLPPLAFRRDWLQAKQVTAKKNLRVVSVKGDSMSPYILDGDVVLIDTGQTTIKDNEVYAIVHGGELRIKRLMKTFDNGLRIRSDSAEFPEEILTPSQAESLLVAGLCLWRAG